MAEPLLVDLKFHSCPSQLGSIRAEIRRLTRREGCSEELSSQLALVLDEAIANVIRHGYQGKTDGEIRLLVYRDGRDLEFQLRDYAGAVDAACIKPRDLSECRPGGLGINFIDSVMDSWEFRCPEEGPGNLLVMRRNIDRPARPVQRAHSNREY